MTPDMRTQFTEHFLLEMRTAITEDRFEYKDDRSDNKNYKTQSLLQYTYQDVVKEFSLLSNDKHVGGPIQDMTFPKDRELWEFKKAIQGYVIYFKVIKIISENRFVGISFHEDE